MPGLDDMLAALSTPPRNTPRDLNIPMVVSSPSAGLTSGSPSPQTMLEQEMLREMDRREAEERMRLKVQALADKVLHPEFGPKILAATMMKPVKGVSRDTAPMYSERIGMGK